jgi:hypothetical protein
MGPIDDRIGFPSWKWNGSKNAPTLTPSVHHNTPECGWHGYLRDGEG